MTRRQRRIWCPSIRFLPTSAPWLSAGCGGVRRVSVDQVPSDVSAGPRPDQPANSRVSVDQVPSDVSASAARRSSCGFTRVRRSGSFRRQRPRSLQTIAGTPFSERRASTGKITPCDGLLMRLRLPLSQGISRGSSNPRGPLHHRHTRGGCSGVRALVGTMLIDSTVPGPSKGKTHTVAFPLPVAAS